MPWLGSREAHSHGFLDVRVGSAQIHSPDTTQLSSYQSGRTCMNKNTLSTKTTEVPKHTKVPAVK
jgi:hypothetical protein